jgi:hypothetical protein
MALWTDIITPQELTGYARASDSPTTRPAKGTLAQFLPNREVADIVVRFVAGQGPGRRGRLPRLRRGADHRRDALGQAGHHRAARGGRNIPVTEYNQLRGAQRNPSDESVRETILNATDVAVRAVADSVERVRGGVISTGVATISNEGGFSMADSFGRSGTHDVTAGTLWSTTRPTAWAT